MEHEEKLRRNIGKLKLKFKLNLDYLNYHYESIMSSIATPDVHLKTIKSLTENQIKNTLFDVSTLHCWSKEKNNTIHVMDLGCHLRSAQNSDFFVRIFTRYDNIEVQKDLGRILTYFEKKSPDKTIVFHFLLDLQKGKTAHLCYATIQIAPTNMSVHVYDPDPDPNTIWAGYDMLIEKITKESLENSKKMKAFFQEVSRELGKELVFTREYVGHQVLSYHDCGRFSTVYLLQHFYHGKKPKELTPYEVYEGFNYLKNHGYEEQAQRIGDRQSLFSQLMDHVKAPARHGISAINSLGRILGYESLKSPGFPETSLGQS